MMCAFICSEHLTPHRIFGRSDTLTRMCFPRMCFSAKLYAWASRYVLFHLVTKGFHLESKSIKLQTIRDRSDSNTATAKKKSKLKIMKLLVKTLVIYSQILKGLFNNSSFWCTHNNAISLEDLLESMYRKCILAVHLGWPNHILISFLVRHCDTYDTLLLAINRSSDMPPWSVSLKENIFLHWWAPSSPEP